MLLYFGLVKEFLELFIKINIGASSIRQSPGIAAMAEENTIHLFIH